jgi:hypothetical protein
MKKVIFPFAVILFSILVVSFQPNKQINGNETTIIVTSDKPTTFDMFQDQNVKRGLKTPYELKIDSYEARFVFKAYDNSPLHVDLKNRNSKLHSTMVVTVLLITNSAIQVFGID